VNQMFLGIAKNCKDLYNCTAKENSDFINSYFQIIRIKIFIKYKILQPLNVEFPVQTAIQVITINLFNKIHSVYLKLFEITTDQSIFPYMPIGVESFISIDYSLNPNDSLAVFDYGRKIFLSENFSFMSRKYHKLDTLLWNFIGVLNALIITGEIFTFFFCKFENEFFIYNNLLKTRTKVTTLNKIVGNNPDNDDSNVKLNFPLIPTPNLKNKPENNTNLFNQISQISGNKELILKYIKIIS
jgi:hypothetical protein